MFFSPAKRDPAVYFCELPSSLASFLHFLHSTQKLSQRKYYHDPSLLESFYDSPGCMKSKVRAGYKACLGPRICSYSNLQACSHTHMCTCIHTHVVFKPHELLSFLKMPSFHILPYLSTVSSFFLVDIINTNPNFETLLKYLFLCKKWKLSPSVTTCQGYLLIYACMHVLSRLTLCNPMDYTLSVGFSRKEYWSGLIFLTPGDLPNPGIEPPASLASSALAGGFFSVEPPEKP